MSDDSAASEVRKLRHFFIFLVVAVLVGFVVYSVGNALEKQQQQDACLEGLADRTAQRLQGDYVPPPPGCTD